MGDLMKQLATSHKRWKQWAGAACGVLVGVLCMIMRMPLWISLVLAGASGVAASSLYGNIAPRPDEDEASRRQRMRSIAIALTLGGLVTLFYVATIVRLGGQAMNRPM